MNNEQRKRLNKALKIFGYIISGIIVWFYVTKWLALLIVPDGGDDAVLVGILIGILWPFVVFWIIDKCYNLYTWIATGKSKGLLGS